MRIGQTTAVVFISKIGASVLGFLATIYIARILGAEVLGYYAAIVAVAAWLEIPARTGIAQSVQKRISEDRESDQYFTAGLLLILCVSFVTAGLTWLFQDQLNAYIGIEASLFVIVIFLSDVFRKFVGMALSGELRVHISAMLNTLKVGMRSTLQILLIFVGFGLGGMVTGYVVAASVSGVIGLIIISSKLARPARRHFKSLFDFAKYAWLGNMRSRSFNNLDIIVLTAFVSPTLVGIYSVAWGITQILITFGGAIRASIFPEISRGSEQKREKFVSNVVSDAISYTGIIVIPGLVGGVLLSDYLLGLYGDEFTQGVTVLSILLFTTVLLDYFKQFMKILNAIDRPDIAFRINAVFITTNIILNIILVYLYGWVGAAIATAAVAGLCLVLSFWSLRSLIVFSAPYLEVIKQVAAALGMGVFVTISEYFLLELIGVASNALVLIVLIVVGAIVYFSILIIISERFRKVISTNISFAY